MARDPLCSSPVPTVTHLDHGAGRRVLGLGAPPCIAIPECRPVYDFQHLGESVLESVLDSEAVCRCI